MLNKEKIGIIGGGNMGKALAGGLIGKGHPSTSIWIGDHRQTTCDQLQERWGIHTNTDNKMIAQEADILVLAIKPQTMKQVVTEIAPILGTHPTLLISIAAGIQTQQIQHWLKTNIPLIRAMPNTPALVGYGITGLFAPPELSNLYRQKAEQLLQTVGQIVWIEQEPLLDVVTALSGSGPAYFFYIMEGLIQSATTLGLPEEIAKKLTLNTALGSAQMALQSPENLTTLRAKVTSPGGTTEQAINVLKNGKLGALLDEALQRATTHGKTLNQQYK